jgi:hypothetical protein
MTLALEMTREYDVADDYGARRSESHRIIHIRTGSAPFELIFLSRYEAQFWLDNYGVSLDYKDTNYRIVSCGVNRG